jgi:hypothetical protein
VGNRINLENLAFLADGTKFRELSLESVFYYLNQPVTCKTLACKLQDALQGLGLGSAPGQGKSAAAGFQS